MSVILGLATMSNSAAALFKDGKLVAAIEEERLTRVKNDGAFPHQAIAEVLRIAGLKFSDIDEVAVYWQPWRMVGRGMGTMRKILQRPSAAKSVTARIGALFVSDASSDESQDSGWMDLFRIRKILTAVHGPADFKLHYINHHLTHQLYAEAMRDWDSFVSLSYDGGGEESSTIVSVVRNGKREGLADHRWPNSLGHFYSTFTGFLGFKMLEGEYKMMGLAPYGKPNYRDAILREILILDDDGGYRVNTALCDYHSALRGEFHPRMEELFGTRREPGTAPNERHVDLAASVQAAFEAALHHILEPVRKANPDLRKLVISGGCALNVTANGTLIADGTFDEVIIPPAPHDAGCAVGAALACIPSEQVDLPSVRSPYQGADWADADITAALDQYCAEPQQALPVDQFLDRVSDLLAEGKIIAWFQGRAEFGPRALGARSFLADPRKDSIRDDLNVKIKKREHFRPFAPSVAEEAASTFFEIDQTSPYMNIVARVRDDRAADIPAITHTDQTARVHTVSQSANPLYHALLTRFGEKTGVPVLLNTSFNIQEPIVYSPLDACATFAASGVDALVIGDYVVLREALKDDSARAQAVA